MTKLLDKSFSVLSDILLEWKLVEPELHGKRGQSPLPEPSLAIAPEPRDKPPTPHYPG